MKILAMDTSSKALSVAVLEDEQLLAETRLNIKKNHSISLMPTIDFLMTSLELTPQDLERIVVAKGPGSYTGLRIAAATAKTLAYTLKIDLVGVSSLLSLVPENMTGLVIPIMDARRNHVYAGFYEHSRALKPEVYLPFETVLKTAREIGREQICFVGETEAFREQIESNLPQADIESTLPDAYRLGKIGRSLAVQSVHDFVPAYLKRVEAEENWLKGHSESRDSYIKRL